MAADDPDPAASSSSLSSSEARVFQLGAVVRRAMHASYQMLTQEAQEGVRQAVDARALVHLLLDKGIISREELDEARQVAEREVTAERARSWNGPWLTTKDDKPEPVIDCKTRHAHCQATCCSLYRVYLAADEVRRGDLVWDLAVPYALPRGPDGACAYFDATTLGCRVWQHRPWVCRQYTCANSTDIWEDFTAMIPAERVRERTRLRVHAATSPPRAHSDPAKNG
jgi:Fe-S-cluster containining protein